MKGTKKMAKRSEIRKFEDFVRGVLDKNFNQEIDPDALRAAARKIQIICASANIRRNPRTALASSQDQKSC